MREHKKYLTLDWIGFQINHLGQTGQTYFQHLKWAMYAGALLLWAGLASVIHAVFPFVFSEISERITHDLSQRAKLRKSKN